MRTHVFTLAQSEATGSVARMPFSFLARGDPLNLGHGRGLHDPKLHVDFNFAIGSRLMDSNPENAVCSSERTTTTRTDRTETIFELIIGCMLKKPKFGVSVKNDKNC